MLHSTPNTRLVNSHNLTVQNLAAHNAMWIPYTHLTNIMTLTSLSLIKLKPTYDHLDFLEALMTALEIQDDWVRRHKPHMLRYKKGGNLSSMYIARSNPPYLLITAPWESKASHEQWMQTDEHEYACALMREFFATGDDAVVSFHLKTAGRQTVIPETLSNIGSFDLSRVYVDADERQALQERYNTLEDAMANLHLGDQIWAGWRLDGGDELILLSSHHSVPLQQAAQSAGLAKRSETRCFELLG